MGITLVVKVNIFLFTSFALFISVYNPSQLKSMKMLPFGTTSSLTVLLRLLFPMVLFSVTTPALLLDVSTYVYSILQNVNFGGKLRTKQCSTGVRCFISAGCPRAFIMYNAVSLQEETLTCSIFSKFILQWNSSYPGGPSGLQNTLLEMLLNRLGGCELASLLEKKCLRDCIPNNLPLSLWVWDLALCATLQQSFHLDTPLLQIQNTEKLHRTENNSVRMHLGQILDQKIQKDKKEKSPWHPSLKSHEPWVSGAKACTQYHRVGAGRHLSHPSSLTSGHTPALSSNKEWAHTLSRSKQGGFLVFIFSCSQQKNPNRALPEFLVWSLVNFYWLGRAKNPGWYHFDIDLEFK